jgi:hypothetical protein
VTEDRVLSLIAVVAATSIAIDARAQCDARAGRDVLVSATVGGAVGISAALGSSAIAATAGRSREYRFYVGAAAGAGVSLGLATLYGLFDYYTGCHMVSASRHRFVWSVPIVTFIVGAALPVAIWGAAPKKEDIGDAAQASTSALTVGLRAAF